VISSIVEMERVGRMKKGTGVTNKNGITELVCIFICVFIFASAERVIHGYDLPEDAEDYR